MISLDLQQQLQIDSFIDYDPQFKQHLVYNTKNKILKVYNKNFDTVFEKRIKLREAASTQVYFRFASENETDKYAFLIDDNKSCMISHGKYLTQVQIGNIFKKNPIINFIWLSPSYLLVYSEQEIKLMKILFGNQVAPIVDGYQELKWKVGEISQIKIITKSIILIEYIKNYIRQFTFAQFQNNQLVELNQQQKNQLNINTQLQDIVDIQPFYIQIRQKLYDQQLEQIIETQLINFNQIQQYEKLDNMELYMNNIVTLNEQMQFQDESMSQKTDESKKEQKQKQKDIEQIKEQPLLLLHTSKNKYYIYDVIKGQIATQIVTDQYQFNLFMIQDQLIYLFNFSDRKVTIYNYIAFENVCVTEQTLKPFCISQFKTQEDWFNMRINQNLCWVYNTDGILLGSVKFNMQELYKNMIFISMFEKALIIDFILIRNRNYFDQFLEKALQEYIKDCKLDYTILFIILLNFTAEVKLVQRLKQKQKYSGIFTVKLLSMSSNQSYYESNISVNSQNSQYKREAVYSNQGIIINYQGKLYKFAGQWLVMQQIFDLVNKISNDNSRQLLNKMLNNALLYYGIDIDRSETL